MLKKMNLPNKLTCLRIVLVPVFVVFTALPIEWVWTKWVAHGLYIVASLTDCADGYISRKYDMVTKFGKIMDPLADKLLVAAGFIMLAGLNIIPAWIAMIIIFRDLCVTSFRIFGAEGKPVFQLIGICLAILGVALYTSNNAFGDFLFTSVNMTMFQLMINVLMSVSICVAVIFTIWSLVDYFFKFKNNINIEE